MRFSIASLACCVATVSAQYLSEGWKPGQAATQTREAASQYTAGAQPAAGTGASSQGGLASLLSEGPIGSLLAKVGVNLSAGAGASYQELWDQRISLIDDDNYEELIVHEPLTPEEEAERVWFLIITTAAGQQQQGGISKLVDAQFDAAFNATVLEDDLPNVRWGRIDYLNVTYITTKWNVWRGPFLVVLKDRGQSLRFYHATQARLNSTIMRTFLKEEGWKNTQPWSSSFAPGGSREFILHYFAFALQKIYTFVVRVPRFVLMVVTGAAGSVVMGLLHRSEKKKAASAKPSVKPSIKAADPTTTPTASPAKKGSAKGKKSGKK